jgi:hypothetical protein
MICNLFDSVCKQLLHAHSQWPATVHFALWPYALRNAALFHNSLPVLKDGTSKLELFSSIQMRGNMKHMHTFGCPVFTLQNALASGNTLPRWSPRARLGLNLGPSPNHTQNVYLVLNLITGCVSLQYHCKFDDFFETTRHGGPDVSGTICWQQLAGLTRMNQILSDIARRPTGCTTTSNEMLSDMPSEMHVSSEEFSVTEIDYNPTSNDISGSRESQALQTPCLSQASIQAKGVAPNKSTVTAGTSRSGRVRTMS